MKKYKFSHLFIYHDYIVAVFIDGGWEVICSKYYFRADGIAADRTAAETAAKAIIEELVAEASEK